MFLIAVSIHSFGIVFYLIFANGELQDWASQDHELGEIDGNSLADIEKDSMAGSDGDSKSDPNQILAQEESRSRYGTCDTK